MNVAEVLGDYVDRRQLCELLGRPGKPLSSRTITRYESQPNGLAFSEVGGRKIYHIDWVKEFLAARTRHPNRRRKAA